MPHLPEDRLALVRRLYEASELTIAEIAVLAEVSESAIYQRARRETWATTRRPGVTPRRQKLRPPVPPTPALRALAGDQGTAASRTLTPSLSRSREREEPAAGAAPAALPGVAGFQDVDRAETARRLWLAVNRHLAMLEAEDAPDGAIRAAQNLSTLARTLETLIDVERGLARDASARTQPLDEGPEDIDEFRNEIARRLESLLGARPV